MPSKRKKEPDFDELSRESIRKEEVNIEDLHKDLEAKLEEQGFIFDKKKFLVAEASSTFLEKATDRVAGFVGSWGFIIVFISSIIVWVNLNFWIIAFDPVDPFPFVLLNLMLSMIAAIQAPIILMSQNRQYKLDRKQEEINIEKEILDFKQDRLDLIIDQKQWEILKDIHSRIKRIEERVGKKGKGV